MGWHVGRRRMTWFDSYGMDWLMVTVLIKDTDSSFLMNRGRKEDRMI